MHTTTNRTPAAALTLRPLSGRWGRLGVALHFVARLAPFANFRSTELVATLDAQIQREHCLFALRGERVVGYLGWALYDAAVAERFARGGAAPANALAHGSDVAWILTAASVDGAALMALVRALRARYPAMRVMGIRHKGAGRRVVFDRAPRGDAGPSAAGQHYRKPAALVGPALHLPKARVAQQCLGVGALPLA